MMCLQRWRAGRLSRSLWVESRRRHVHDVVSFIRRTRATSDFAAAVEEAAVRHQQTLPSRFVLLTTDSKDSWTVRNREVAVAVYIVAAAVWLSGNALALINVVALRRARLVLGWVTVRGYTILVFNQATQPGHPSDGSRNEYWRWSRPPIGKKRRVLRNNRLCFCSRLRRYINYLLTYLLTVTRTAGILV